MTGTVIGILLFSAAVLTGSSNVRAQEWGTVPGTVVTHSSGKVEMITWPVNNRGPRHR